MGRKRQGGMKLLGSFHGEGSLAAGGQELGPVTYEIDAYSDREGTSANGRIEGTHQALDRAFAAGSATLVIASGAAIDVVLSEVEPDATAEITARGPLPEF